VRSSDPCKAAVEPLSGSRRTIALLRTIVRVRSPDSTIGAPNATRFLDRDSRRGGSARLADENGLADVRTSWQGSSGDTQNGGS
jgi:hypothetical protein